MKTATAILGLFLASTTLAQADTGFTLTGPIESFTLKPGADPNRGGTIKVHGIEAVLPDNLQIQMPGTFKTPVELFGENPAGGGVSGLALDEAVKPIAAFEATLIGNIVGNRHIAGLAYITQHGLANGAGFVKAIDASTGMMRVGSDLSLPPTAKDAFVMLNDIDGVYGPKPTPAQITEFNIDKRFTVDDENPTVHAETGYPMCVPGTENAARCPAGNRPLGPMVRRFMMDEGNRVKTPGGAPGFQTQSGEIIPTCQKGPGPTCDSNFAAPIVVGDYINYAGTLTKHNDGSPNGTIYISAHTIGVSAGIYTQPATVAAVPTAPMKAYTMLEVSLIGTMGPPIPNPLDPLGRFIDMEAQDRLKIEGTSTDPSRIVEIYAIDEDAASGSETLRLIATTAVPIAVPVGRYRRIIGSRARVLYKDFFGPAKEVKGAPREVAVMIARDATGAALTRDGEQKPVPGPTNTTANGLIAGQYVAPVGEFIFPENTGFGDPVLAANFECLRFLRPGLTPLQGRIDPWPASTLPTKVDCGPDPK